MRFSINPLYLQIMEFFKEKPSLSDRKTSLSKINLLYLIIVTTAAFAINSVNNNDLGHIYAVNSKKKDGRVKA